MLTVREVRRCSDRPAEELERLEAWTLEGEVVEEGLYFRVAGPRVEGQGLEQRQVREARHQEAQRLIAHKTAVGQAYDTVGQKWGGGKQAAGLGGAIGSQGERSLADRSWYAWTAIRPCLEVCEYVSTCVARV